MRKGKKVGANNWSPDNYIKSHLRKIFRWSQRRKDCLKAGFCQKCLRKTQELFADHIEPVVDPQVGFKDWNTYIERMFNGKLQALCKSCHSLKTKAENTIRRKVKKANAKPE